MNSVPEHATPLQHPRLTKFLANHTFSQVFVLVDEHTLQHCYPLVTPALPAHTLIQIQSGEEHKTLATCSHVWEQLTQHQADRNSLLINLGGGVIGDLGGFAAGCYKRGIKFANIPTTLLAMVDASVGAKTGIDFEGLKNQIGLFNEAEAIFINTAFLKTLPPRELLSGFAEVLKHYLIADGPTFNKIATDLPLFSALNWDAIVEHSVTIKSAIVEEDPLEQGNRKALNLGHTIGHAVESYFLTHEKLLHGEAVAVGLICEAYISQQAGFITDAELNTITSTILHYFKLPVLPANAFGTLLGLLKQDKKSISGKNQFTLLKGIGNYCIHNSVEEETIKQSLQFYNRQIA
jgi:3-dehydroquinate synthase